MNDWSMFPPSLLHETMHFMCTSSLYLGYVFSVELAKMAILLGGFQKYCLYRLNFICNGCHIGYMHTGRISLNCTVWVLEMISRAKDG